MAETVSYRFVWRGRSAANWAALNEILLNKEAGIELDTMPRKWKIGDGVTPWNDLPYQSGIDIDDANIGDGRVLEWDATEQTHVYGDAVKSVVSGPNISVDSTDPFNPIVTSTLGAVTLKGRVANYAALPSSGNVSGDAYANDEDFKIYIWDGSSWPSDGDGLSFSGTNVYTITSAANAEPSYDNTFVNITNQAVALTINNPTGVPVNGHEVTIRIKDNNTSQTIAWGSKYRGIGFALPSATIPGQALIFNGIYNAVMDAITLFTYAHGYDGQYEWWPYVKGQFHFDGTDGGAVFTDTSSFANVATVVGTPTTEADNAKFGSAGLKIPGTGSLIKFDNTNFRIPPNTPFTIRFWIKKMSGSWPASENWIAGIWKSGDLSWVVTINASRQPTFYWANNAGTVSYPYSPGAIPDDTNWHFITVNQDAANQLFFTIDGTYYNSSSSTGPGSNGCRTPTAAPLTIGAQDGETSVYFPTNAALDEMEIIIGMCLYTKGANHPVPTSPFPSE